VSATTYLAALSITLALEVPIYAIELRRAFGGPLASGARTGLAVNLTSHPLGFLAIAPLVYPLLGAGGSLLAVELIVWIGEAGLVWLWLQRRPGTIGLISLLANSVSLAVGFVVLS